MCVRFEDLRACAGIDFRYFNGHDPAVQGFRIFEYTGGGVAVLDYDLDGWPDLYFTQGGHRPRTEGQPEYLDCLYRNLGNGQFEQVASSVGIHEDRYSQGATVGDYDSDGFPDVYVANLGRNRLFRE